MGAIMLTVAIENQDLERTIHHVAQSEGKSSAEIVREALMRHFDLKPGAAAVNLFELGKDLFDGKGNPAIQGVDAEQLLRKSMRG